MATSTPEELPPLSEYEHLLMAGLSADTYLATAATLEGVSNAHQANSELKKYGYSIAKKNGYSSFENVEIPPSVTDIFVGDSPREFDVSFSAEGGDRPDVTIVLKGQTDRVVTVHRAGSSSSKNPFDCLVEGGTGNPCTGQIPAGDIALFLSSLAFDPVTRNRIGRVNLASLDIQDQGVALLLQQPLLVTESYTRFDAIPVDDEDDTTISIAQNTTAEGATSYQVGLRRTVRSDRGAKRTTDEYVMMLPAIESAAEYLLQSYDHTQTYTYSWAPDQPTMLQGTKFTDPSVLSYMYAAVKKANPSGAPLEPFEEYMAVLAEIDDAPASPEEHADLEDKLISHSEAVYVGETNTAVIDAIIRESIEETKEDLE